MSNNVLLLYTLLYVRVSKMLHRRRLFMTNVPKSMTNVPKLLTNGTK